MSESSTNSGSQRDLLDMIQSIWLETLGLDNVDPDENFFDLGGDSISGLRLSNRLQSELSENVLNVIVFDAPTINEMKDYLLQHYPQAIQKRFPEISAETEATRDYAMSDQESVDESLIESVRQRVAKSYASGSPVNVDGEKNPKAVFIFSPPRSGSTLLRIMMAGNPALFSPPELNILPFDTLRESRKISGERLRALLEDGILNSLMYLKGWELETAKEFMDDMEKRDVTIKELYGVLQENIGGRILVDKSPINVLSLDNLKRAESYFDQPKYIHLTRHPYGMIKSYEKSHLDLLLAEGSNLSTRSIAEAIWVIGHRNLLEFLQDLPVNRSYQLSYEDLVSDPEKAMRDICRFIDVEYHEDMLTPYDGNPARMTEGVIKEGRMIGDSNFHKHKEISAKSAYSWQGYYKEDFLGESARTLASDLGYDI